MNQLEIHRLNHPVVYVLSVSPHHDDSTSTIVSLLERRVQSENVPQKNDVIEAGNLVGRNLLPLDEIPRIRRKRVKRYS